MLMGVDVIWSSKERFLNLFSIAVFFSCSFLCVFFLYILHLVLPSVMWLVLFWWIPSLFHRFIIRNRCANFEIQDSIRSEFSEFNLRNQTNQSASIHPNWDRLFDFVPQKKRLDIRRVGVEWNQINDEFSSKNVNPKKQWIRSKIKWKSEYLNQNSKREKLNN